MMLPKHPARPLPSRLFSYARVSTDDQGTDPQLVGSRHRLHHHPRGARLRRRSRPPCPCPPPARYPRRLDPGGRAARSPRPLGQPPARRDRAARGRRRAFPQPARSDRHHHTPRHVLTPGARRRRPAEAGADRRTHQGRTTGRAQSRSCRRQSGLARLAASIRTRFGTRNHITGHPVIRFCATAESRT